jgi:hypothetical protein
VQTICTPCSEIALIGLADPSKPLDHGLLDAAGGFAWWYVDLVDAHGNGCVIIVSFGLPFLPGREGASRSGRRSLPRQRPSVNVAVYRGGRRALYLLHEVDADDAVWPAGGETARVGASRLSSGTVDGVRRCLAELDLPLPGRGGRLTGRVEVSGPEVRVDATPTGDPRHQWTPLCTATVGHADLEVDGRPFLRVRGRGYHDRNGSTLPLAALGIRHWLWGRAPVGGAERIWYLLWPEHGEPVAWGLEVGSDGAAVVREHLEVRRQGLRLGWFGLPWHRRLTLRLDGQPWLDVEHARLVDDGFFYQRWQARVRGPGGEQGLGFAEAVRPGRVDRWWNRWLVRMAVHHASRPNSPFLPLFSGARRRPAAEVEGPA